MTLAYAPDHGPEADAARQRIARQRLADAAVARVQVAAAGLTDAEAADPRVAAAIAELDAAAHRLVAARRGARVEPLPTAAQS